MIKAMLRRNTDLVGCVFVTLSLILVLLWLPKDFLITYGLLGFFIAFIPLGYSLATILFPQKISLSLLRRLYFSIAFSILVMWFVSFLLVSRLWYDYFIGIAVVFCLLVLIIGSLAIFRRELTTNNQAFLTRTPLLKWTDILSTFGFIFILGLLFNLSSQSQPSQPFTEFYILGADPTDPYPLQLTPGQRYELTFGVRNHEGELVNYRLKGPSGLANEFIYPITLRNEQTWQDKLALTAPTGQGSTKLSFELYSDKQLKPYRQLHFFVNIAK
jgi:uncharacterized membrane protein